MTLMISLRSAVIGLGIVAAFGVASIVVVGYTCDNLGHERGVHDGRLSEMDDIEIAAIAQYTNCQGEPPACQSQLATLNWVHGQVDSELLTNKHRVR